MKDKTPFTDTLNALNILTKQDYQMAIDVQTACNLGAVVHSFSRVMKKLQHQARKLKKGTDWINNHPICMLYATQIHFLTEEHATDSTYAEAYGEVEQAIENLSTLKP